MKCDVRMMINLDIAIKKKERFENKVGMSSY